MTDLPVYGTHDTFTSLVSRPRTVGSRGSGFPSRLDPYPGGSNTPCEWGRTQNLDHSNFPISLSPRPSSSPSGVVDQNPPSFGVTKPSFTPALISFVRSRRGRVETGPDYY